MHALAMWLKQQLHVLAVFLLVALLALWNFAQEIINEITPKSRKIFMKFGPKRGILNARDLKKVSTLVKLLTVIVPEQHWGTCVFSCVTYVHPPRIVNISKNQPKSAKNQAFPSSLSAWKFPYPNGHEVI